MSSLGWPANLITQPYPERSIDRRLVPSTGKRVELSLPALENRSQMVGEYMCM